MVVCPICKKKGTMLARQLYVDGRIENVCVPCYNKACDKSWGHSGDSKVFKYGVKDVYKNEEG